MILLDEVLKIRIIELSLSLTPQHNLLQKRPAHSIDNLHPALPLVKSLTALQIVLPIMVIDLDYTGALPKFILMEVLLQTLFLWRLNITQPDVVKKYEEFYNAKEEHQNYYVRMKNKNPYCRAVITPKLEKLNLEK